MPEKLHQSNVRGFSPAGAVVGRGSSGAVRRTLVSGERRLGPGAARLAQSRSGGVRKPAK